MQTAKQIADAHLEQSRNIASINLLHAQEELGRRLAADKSTMTLKNLLDFAEHSYKVSGLQGKQEPKQNAPTFSVTIDLGGGSRPAVIDVTPAEEYPVEVVASEVAELGLDVPPAALRSSSGNLLALLDEADE